MNTKDRKVLEDARILIQEGMETITEIAEELDERIDNIMETFPDGNPTSEQLEEERDQLETTASDIESAIDELDELIYN